MIPFHTLRCELSDLPITVLCFSTASSGRLLRPACDAGLFGHPAEDHPHGPGDVKHCDIGVPDYGGDVKVLSKETLSSLATKMQCITFQIAITDHSVPPQSHCVFVIVYIFIKWFYKKDI